MRLIKFVIIFSVFPFVAISQTLGFGSSGGDITISAIDGVVWDRNKQEIEINNNATMVQGDTKLVADKIVVNYIESNGKQEIILLKADDNVTISTSTETLKGDNAIYEPNRGLAVLSGKNANLIMQSGKIKAPVFEYYSNDNKVIARDDVIISSDKGDIKSAVAVAYLADEKSKKKNNSGIKRFELFDNVEIKTKGEFVKGDKAIYNVTTGIIVIEGDVSVKKGKNILKGDIGEVNLSSGISKLRSTSGKRVGGVITPSKE